MYDHAMAIQECWGRTPEFEKVVSALGVVFDLSEAILGGDMVVSKQASRADDVEEILKKAARGAWFSEALAAAASGRIRFSRTQVFGRVGGKALFSLSEAVRKRGVRVEPVEEALRYWVRALRVSERWGPGG